MIFPAGKYIISDLCYVIPDALWDKVCETMTDEGGMHTLIIEDEKLRYTVFGTEHGDGAYFDQAGREYGVDSGTIGIIEYSDKLNLNNAVLGLYHEEEFPDSFICHKVGAVLHFGPIVIDTDPEPVYEDLIIYEDDEDLW